MIAEKDQLEIIKIIDDCSGGLKLTELVVYLIEERINFELETLEDDLKHIPGVKILSYTHKSLNRIKSFVYTE